MRKPSFSETKIDSVLEKNEAGVSIPDLARKYGGSTATLYGWKSQFRGMDASQLKEIPPQTRWDKKPN